MPTEIMYVIEFTILSLSFYFYDIIIVIIIY